ncbi:MAG: tRNA (cytidine32/uridine32-2'-O)-methyltransferase [Rhodothermales bacterium]
MAQDNRSETLVADHLNKIRIVLIDTTHPGNIGATARAMKVMGVTSLHLVNPAIYPHADATARASGADDILQHAMVHETLDDALDGCSLVLGTSARLRSLPMPQLNLRSAAEVALTDSGGRDVAILFGRERHGLTNEQMQRCHRLVHIETNPEYGSLNLGQAVQLVTYELRMAILESGRVTPPSTDSQAVDASQMEMFYRHLEQTLLDLEFLNPDQPRKLMMRLRRLFNRSRPDQNEINILRGILAAAQRAKTGRTKGIEENN